VSLFLYIIVMKKYIEVKLDIEGLHCWESCNIDEVDYLKHLHRHTFGFLCRAEVTHNDRDIEFIEFKHKIKEYLGKKYYDPKYKCCNFTGQSCESLAEDLIAAFNLCRCSVSEDNEFFGICEI
jgi:hypothetical protein